MRINGDNNLELIKQLDEMAKTDMDEETFNRLVKYATKDIKQLHPDTSDDDMLEVIHALIENIAGYEEADDAVALANKVLARVKENISF